MVEGQDEQNILAALLRGIYMRSPFMAKLAQRILSTLWEFMVKVDNFVNIEDTL